MLGEDCTRQIHNLNQSQFKSKFYDDYKRIKGNKGIGVISDYDEQPIYLNSRFGPFCTVTSGLVENAEELAAKLLKKGISFSEVSKRDVNTPELIAKIISQGDNLIDGIEKMFDVIEGACSLLLLHNDGIYAARDRFGYTPLIAGKRADAWAVTAETSAFPGPAVGRFRAGVLFSLGRIRAALLFSLGRFTRLWPAVLPAMAGCVFFFALMRL